MPGAVLKAFPAMGTVFSFRLGGADKELAERLKEKSIELHRAWSVFEPSSEVSRLNAEAGKGAVGVSFDTFAVLKESKRLAGLTKGAFDITAGALTSLWRKAEKAGVPPTEDELNETLRLVGSDLIGIDADARTVGLPIPGMSIDLGGIAKGYAADMLAGILRENRIGEAVLDLGGTVAVIGNAVIGVQDPFRRTGVPMGSLELNDEFAVTSGTYERCFCVGGTRYGHIVDPRTGKPCDTELVSVTLVGKKATELDALATAAFVLGTEETLPLLNERGIGAMIVNRRGEVFVTPGLQERFRLFERSE